MEKGFRWQTQSVSRSDRLSQRFSSGLHGNTAADSVQSEWPLWHAAKTKHFARRRSELKLKLELVEEKQKLLVHETRETLPWLNIIVKLICKNNFFN
ncbi:hypothetical protein TNCV_889491 [Trichonephila clavipes]|nr:hypothetical protein TNCV_889491 [Trichonephila clavipes]